MKYHTYFKSRKKHDYMVNTNRSKLLNSFYLENQAWGPYTSIGKYAQ
jgi:hypothetical protein